MCNANFILNVLVYFSNEHAKYAENLYNFPVSTYFYVPYREILITGVIFMIIVDFYYGITH